MSQPLSATSRVPRWVGPVLGLVAMLTVIFPIICLPFAIGGWILSRKKALTMPPGTERRWLPLAGVALSATAASITVLLALFALLGFL